MYEVVIVFSVFLMMMCGVSFSLLCWAVGWHWGIGVLMGFVTGWLYGEYILEPLLATLK